MPRIVVTSVSAELVNPELVRCVVEMMPGLLYQAAEALDAASRLTQDLAPAEVKQSLGVLAMGLEAMRRDCSELRQLHIRSASELGLFAQAQNRALLAEGIRARVLLHLLKKEVAADDASWSPWGAHWARSSGPRGRWRWKPLSRNGRGQVGLADPIAVLLRWTPYVLGGAGLLSVVVVASRKRQTSWIQEVCDGFARCQDP